VEAWARYQRPAGAHLLDWLADGALLVAAPADDGMQAWRVGAALATPQQLSFLAGSLSEAAAHPFDARRFAARAGAAGRAQLYGLRRGEPAAQPLTDASAHDDAPLWAHDGRRLAFASDRRNGSDFDVYLIEEGSAAGPRLVIGGGGRWRVLDWSRDDRRLLLRREFGGGDARLFVADVASGALTAIDAPAGSRPVRMRIPAARFSPDGGSLLYLRDDGSDGFVRLKLAALDGSAPRELAAVADHDLEHFDVSADGRYLAYTWEEAGYSRLAIVDQRDHVALPPPANLPLGVVAALRFDRGGARLALEIEMATAPADVYVIDVASATAARWTQSAVPAGSTPQPARRLRFRTWDRSGGRPRELAAFLYVPARPGPHPVLVLLHDGPEAQFRPGYDAWLQFLVNELGIAVVAPNLRGSSGAGRDFAALDDGPLREDATRDVGSLLVWIGVQPGLDATHVAVMGGGYGGYQALAALAAYGDRLRGAVAIDPTVDLLALGTAAAAAGDGAEFGSVSDGEQRAFLQRISPLGFAGTILRPALLAHLDGGAPGQLSAAEQLLWRMRADRREAAYLAVDPGKCAGDCQPARAAAWAAIGAYLRALLPVDAPAVALSAPPAP
jgi:dipeptidyl aminopeptidase/acylaminoacyl peptidase